MEKKSILGSKLLLQTWYQFVSTTLTQTKPKNIWDWSILCTFIIVQTSKVKLHSEFWFPTMEKQVLKFKSWSVLCHIPWKTIIYICIYEVPSSWSLYIIKCVIWMKWDDDISLYALTFSLNWFRAFCNSIDCTKMQVWKLFLVHL